MELIFHIVEMRVWVRCTDSYILVATYKLEMEYNFMNADSFKYLRGEKTGTSW